MDELREKTVSTETIYKGKILNLRKDKVILPDKRSSMREIVEHSGGVALIPLISNEEILLVKQYRIATGDSLLEIPAGKLEVGEKPKVCAERELEEETGYKSGNIKKIFSFYTSPGYSNEIIHLYLAEDLNFYGQKTDKDEFIEVESIKKNDIIPMINNGKIKDSKTIIGLYHYLLEVR